MSGIAPTLDRMVPQKRQSRFVKILSSSSLSSSSVEEPGGTTSADAAIIAARKQKHKRKQSGVPRDVVESLASARVSSAGGGDGPMETVRVDDGDGDSDSGRDEEGGGGGTGGFHSPGGRGYPQRVFEVDGGGGGSGGPQAFVFDDVEGGVGGLAYSWKRIALLAAALVVGSLVAFSSILGRDSGAKAGTGVGTGVGTGIDPGIAAKPNQSKEKMDEGEEHSSNEGTFEVGSGKEFVIERDHDRVEFYRDPSRVPHMESAGPTAPSDVAVAGGLHVFENVCVTDNVDAPRPPTLRTDLRGLLYFTDDEVLLANPQRCVPCPAADTDKAEVSHWDWDADGDVDGARALGHNCGMNGLHAMYAGSVLDWNTCAGDAENQRLTGEYGQTQSPRNASEVRLYREPTFLLQFDAKDDAASLFDALLAYIPHWSKFRKDGQFPFERVLSHSVDGCLSLHNHGWFCTVARLMGAFGGAKEIPMEIDDSTLFCFEKLYYNEPGYWRRGSNSNSGRGGGKELPDAAMMQEFRDVLFHDLNLPRPRDGELQRKKDAEVGLARRRRVLLCIDDNKTGDGDGRTWSNMDNLITAARSNDKYKNVDFVVVENITDITVAEGARAFNEADAVIAVGGERRRAGANSVFAPDGTTFINLAGCNDSDANADAATIGDFLRFLEIINVTYRSVGRCSDGSNRDVDEEEDDATVCLACDDGGFAMTAAAFEKLVDGVLASIV